MTYNSENTNEHHLKSLIFWNLKNLFQGLLVGIIYAAFLFYFGMVSVLGACSGCLDLFASVTEPFLFVIEKAVTLINSDISFAAFNAIILRACFNGLAVWIMFYAIFTRFKLNVKTSNLLTLSILLAIFFALVMFAVVDIKQGGIIRGTSTIVYVITFFIVCIIFAYVSSVKFKDDSETSFQEIIITIISIIFVALLAVFPLIKL